MEINTGYNRKIVVMTMMVILFFIIGIFFIKSNNNFLQKANVIDAVTDVDVSVEITTNQNSVILKNVFGIQTRGFFDEMMYDRNNPIFKSTKVIQDPEPKLMDNLYSLGMNSYRYPGGTFVRYSHPSTISIPRQGYGIVPQDVKDDNSMYGLDWFTSGNEDSYVKNYQKYLPFSFTDSMIEIAKETGTNRGVMVVANIVYGTPEETVQQIKDFANNGINVLGVEIGNEHYAQPSDVGISMDILDYLNKAKDFSRAIRDEFPDMQIGLIAATAYPDNDTIGRYDYYLNWNQQIASAIQTELYNGKKLYNAYITHIYKPIKCDPASYSSIIDLRNCAIFKQDKLTRASNLANANIGSSWGSINTMPLEEVFAYYSLIFGLNTHAWITEWGLADDVGPTNYPEGVYGNTLVYGQYIQDFYNFVNKYNANPSHPNVITNVFYHTLAGGGLSNTVFSKKGTDEIFIDQQDSEFNRRIPWFSLKVIKPIYNSTTTLGQISVSSFPNSPALKYLNFTTYKDVINDEIYIYFTNKSGLTSKLSSVIVDGLPSENIQNSSAEIVSGQTVFAGNGYNFFDKTGTANNITYQSISNQNFSSIVIPAFSYCYIKLPKPQIIVVSDTSAPTPPSLVSQNYIVGKVELSWSSSSDNVGVVGYDVYKNGVLLASVSGSTLSYFDSDVLDGTTYQYSIKAKDSAQNYSNFSQILTVNIPEIIIPVIVGGGGGYVAPSSNNIGSVVLPPSSNQEAPPGSQVQLIKENNSFSNVDQTLGSLNIVLPTPTRTLNIGSKGNQVSLLQSFLSSYPEIYKEALVTGYYGSLTKKAVINFQKKFDISISIFGVKYYTGITGPRTINKINELYKSSKGQDLFRYF